MDSKKPYMKMRKMETNIMLRQTFGKTVVCSNLKSRLSIKLETLGEVVVKSERISTF